MQNTTFVSHPPQTGATNTPTVTFRFHGTTYELTPDTARTFAAKLEAKAELADNITDGK